MLCRLSGNSMLVDSFGETNRRFLELVRGAVPAPASAHRGLDALRLGRAVLASAEAGRPIPIS